MSVFLAMLVDAYRELNSKRLFWIILSLSGLVVVYFASIGFDEDGMSMLFGLVNIDSPFLTRDSPVSQMLYRSIFSTFIVGIWLAWIATILALISTTTIFPDFIAGGAIDLVLSKPIGRVRLFAMKYLASMLFVLLQVSLFCVGVFFCMGWRLGDWEWKIFAAIPVVTIFYSYLFSVNVLVGVWTRSSLAALLCTMLFWASLSGISMSELLVNKIKTDLIVQNEEADASIARFESTLGSMVDRGGANGPARARIENQIVTLQTERDDRRTVVAKIEPWHRMARGMETMLPKTGYTIGLLDRWLKKDTDVGLMDILSGNVAVGRAGEFHPTDTSRNRTVDRRLEADYEARSWWYIVGSSVAFEFAVLSLACFVFVRRDY